MGDNTFRYSPGAPLGGIQIAGGGRGDRKKKTAAGLSGRDTGGRDTGGRDTDGGDTGGRDIGGRDAGRDMGGRDTGGRDIGGRDIGGRDTGRDTGERDTSGRSAGTGGQGGVGLLAGVRDESDRRTDGGDEAVAAAAVQAEPSATYWRRRFIMLALGLAVLGAASWGLSQALRVHPAGKSPSGTLQTSRNSAAPRAGRPAAGGGQHGVNAGGQGGHGSGSTGRSASGTVTRPSAAPRPTVTTSGFGGFKPTFCSWHSIVLSLSASQVHFGSGQPPAFSLSVVSTQPTDCSFNVGPSHLAVVIKEGPARIWSSADCVNGTGSLVTALRRGVPTVVTIDWNRRTSSPGCSSPARTVPAGSYTAYAVEGSIVSPPVTIRLS